MTNNFLMIASAVPVAISAVTAIRNRSWISYVLLAVVSALFIVGVVAIVFFRTAFPPIALLMLVVQVSCLLGYREFKWLEKNDA